MIRGKSTTIREVAIMVVVAMAWRSQVFDAKPQVPVYKRLPLARKD
jgi:hypothetical protein